jgi:hypothetical protein
MGYMSEKFELNEGKGNIMPNKDAEAKHHYYGSIRVSRDVKQGETIKLQGYKNESKNGNKYIGLQMLDKREQDL